MPLPEQTDGCMRFEWLPEEAVDIRFVLIGVGEVLDRLGYRRGLMVLNDDTGCGDSLDGVVRRWCGSWHVLGRLHWSYWDVVFVQTISAVSPQIVAWVLGLHFDLEMKRDGCLRGVG